MAMNSLRMNEEELDHKPNRLLCFHCGDDCDGKDISIDEKLFCCEGCKLVYEILNEHKLQNYYSLNDHAGTKQKSKSIHQYDYLDNERTVEQIVDFVEGNISKVHFTLPQIHCSSCLWLLENLYRINEGVQASVVDFVKKEVFITYDNGRVSLKEVVILLDKIGYQPLIRLNDLGNRDPIPIDKSLYYKLGLAGFSFGNIMLLSFPEYLGIGTDAEMTQFFGYINFVLILPVLLYSGVDYFKSAWQGLRQKHLNIDVPIALGISALFLRSSFEIFSHTGAGYLDSLAGLIFFLLIGKWIQQQTYKEIAFDRDYKSYFPIAARVMGNGGEESHLSLDQIKVGQHLRMLNGELIPADGILKKGSACIDYSFVSGESEPVRKEVGDQLYAGGRQMGEGIVMLVSKEVSNSYLTKLWNHKTFEKNKEEGTASQLANKVGAIFTGFILIVAFSTLLYWLPVDIGKAINAFTAVLIIACPCAVALSIPFTFSNMIRILGKKGIYLKNINVVESLTKINSIVFDKTGTITDGKKSKLNFLASPVSLAQLSIEEKLLVRSLSMQSMHPLSKMISKLLDGRKLNNERDIAAISVDNFEAHKGEGIRAQVNGNWVYIGSCDFLMKNNIQCDPIEKAATYLAFNAIYRGCFIKEFQYKRSLKELMASLGSWAKIYLLSGDNDNEAVTLTKLFLGRENLFFNKKPDEKLIFITELQESGHHVCMVGDGLNDAGALSQSDVGMVISEDTSNFTPACDIIVDASEFSRIGAIFNYAKTCLTLVFCAYGIALVYNIVGLSFAVRGELSPVIAAILMPLSSVSIVLFGVAGSSFLAKKNGF